MYSLSICFIFGLSVAHFGYDATTHQFWVLSMLLVAYGVAQRIGV